MNKLDKLFADRKSKILNIYCTAGYPSLNSTMEVIIALEQHGADIIEIGIPYSDPVADGPVIQQSNMQALENGMNMHVLFSQLKDMREQLNVPVLLMGYFNPVMQYGVERFCEQAAAVGVDGVIIPDLPVLEFESGYRGFFDKHQLKFIFLVTPETSTERVERIDSLSSGFIYAVSASSTTGNAAAPELQQDYFRKLAEMKLRNPVLVGFGIKDRETFNAACRFTNGAIIGSAYINTLKNAMDINLATKDFINHIRG
jgi:tryptophan synthase alpha chain